MDHFEQSTQGLATHLSTIERKLALQKDAVGQYEKALQSASDKLRECFDRQNDYAQRLVDARQEQARLKQEVANAALAYNGYKQALGDADNATVAAKANLDAVKVQYRDSVVEVRKLEGQNVALQKSTQNAADAFSVAQAKLNGAKAAVKETGNEISKTNSALALSQTQWDAAGETIVRSGQAITSIGKQMQNAESRFRLASAGIKDFDKSAEGLTAKLTLLQEKLVLQNQSVEQYEHALAAAQEQLRAAQSVGDPERIRQATDAVQDAETKLNNARAAVKQTQADIASCNKELKTAASSWTAAGKSLDTFSKRCETVSKSMTKAGRVLATTVTTPILALGTAAIKASVDYESAFTSVRKTVDATEEEFGTLSDSIKQMSTEVASSASNIAEVTAVAGQLGIQNEHLMEFTRTMIDLGNSTDIVADDAASTLAKFANIMNMDQSLFQNLGSTLVDLGNNYATTESSIMEMAMRLAGAGHQVGLSEAQILGFAAALSSVGIEAQMGGSAFSKALVKMEVASATGGQALEDFASVAGMTADQFKTLWDNDPAAAFQAFIVGLSKLDDEGESAIAVLDEIGIKEVRLRDTLLRATNATELFSSTQVTANRAWKENTALVEESTKRYNTTESKLKNLQNTATLFAQTIGNDLNPMIQRLISGASDLLTRFMDMDEAQRLQLIKTAAFIASIGPALLVIGKLSKGFGVVTGGLAKFATAVGKAGGGFKGFMSVLGKSPAVWMAVATAVIAGTVALVDYVTGAKKAREALEGMIDTAQRWKSTAAETFYGNDGLSFLGMSESDFSRDVQSSQSWLDGLLAVWSDGKIETDEIVDEWTASFKTLTGSTRDALLEMKQTADQAGYTSISAQLSDDIDTLDALDQEIAKLLKKRQSKNFTEKDKVRLQELIDTREAIEVKYHLTPADTDGFETILAKLDAEIARAQARGQLDADPSVYENALVAAAQGMAAINQQLDDQYDKEFALIQLMEDGAEKEQAQADLDARYASDRTAAAKEYAEALSQIVMPVWNQEDMKQTGDVLDQLYAKLREYSIAATNGDNLGMAKALEDMNTLTSSLDEGSLVEYLSLLTQIQSLMDAGMSEDEIQKLFPDIDVSAQMQQIASLTQFITDHKSSLEGLSGMFTDAVPEEIVKITTDLDMTGAQARWDEFASNPGSITTEAIIAEYQEMDEAKTLQPTVDAFVSDYTEIPEGASTATLTPTGLLAYVNKYAEVTTGADVSSLTPEIVTAMVAGYQELASGADVSTLKPDEITAYIGQYLENHDVDTSGLKPEAVTAYVLAYEEVNGGAKTTALKPKDVAAIVTEYLLDENVDLSKLSDPQVNAAVIAYAEAIGCDKSELKAEVIAQITSYKQANGIQAPSFIESNVALVGYDLTAYNEFVKNNPVTVTGVVRVGEQYENPSDVLSDPKATFWENGSEIPVNLVPASKIDASTLIAYDDDGTLHVLITPDIQGTQESVAAAAERVTDKYVTYAIFGNESHGDWGWLNDLLGSDLLTWMGNFTMELEAFERNKGSALTLWGLLDGATLSGIDMRINQQFKGDIMANFTTYVAEMVKAIQNGEDVSEADLQNLKDIVDFLGNLQTYGIGENVRAGVAQGMTEAGWDTDAETVASDLETCLNTALGIQSPSTRMMPIGDNVAAGVGVGMTEHDFATDATTVASSLATATGTAITNDLLATYGTTAISGMASAITGYALAGTGSTVSANIKSALSSKITTTTLRPIGLNAMAGLKAGITAGTSGVVSAMKAAAQSAVAAAKKQLKIASPSGVFRDEVGRMTMKGFGQGVLLESREQAKIIHNATRFLTGEAKAGSISTNSNDNRQIYNQTSSVNLSGNSFYIRDEQDVKALAIEIATLTKRQQRGRGLRMA